MTPVLFASSAFAANVNLGPEDIDSHENPIEGSDTYNYDQWHVGSTDNPDASLESSFLFGECSVLAVNPGNDWSNWPQLLKGYSIDDRPNTEEAIRNIISGTSLEVEQGSATLQFPFFIYWGDEDAPEVEFTTVRNAVAGTGTVTIDDSTPIILTRPTDQFLNIDEFFDYVNATGEIFGDGNSPAFKIELLGVGFNASAAQNSEISSFSFGGDTYYFGEECAPAEEEPSEEPDEEPSEETPTSPTPPDKVDTASGSFGISLELGLGALLLSIGAAAALRIQRRTSNKKS